MGKAKVLEKIGEDGMYRVQLTYDTKVSDIRYIDKQIQALFKRIDELQNEIEEEIAEDLPEDPEVPEDPEEPEDPTEDETDPIPDPDPPEEDPPEDDPPIEDQGSISGTIKGFV